METKNRAYILALLVVVIFLMGGASFFYFRTSPRAPVPDVGIPIAENDGEVASSSDVSIRGVEFDETGTESPGASAKSAVPVPDLDRPIVFSATVTPSQQALITTEIESIVAVLRKNSDAFNSWIGLGIERKLAGDYEGARDAWEYAGTIRPRNSVSFGNLGDLYAYYLRDPHKAEQRFLTAVKNDPSMTYLFVQTADFYMSVLGNRPKAIAFLQQALRDNPRNQDLKKVLESYAKS